MQRSGGHNSKLHQHAVRARVQDRQVVIEEVIVGAVEGAWDDVERERPRRRAHAFDEVHCAAILRQVEYDRDDELDHLGEENCSRGVVYRLADALAHVHEEADERPQADVRAKEAELERRIESQDRHVQQKECSCTRCPAWRACMHPELD